MKFRLFAAALAAVALTLPALAGDVNGENPVAMVVARENSPELVKLIKKLDAATVKNTDKSMGSFVVFLNDKEGLEKELADVASQEKIQKTVLAVDNTGGPKAYNVAKEADVTVVLYVDRKVKANHAFKKGELTDKDIETIVSEVPMILTETK